MMNLKTHILAFSVFSMLIMQSAAAEDCKVDPNDPFSEVQAMPAESHFPGACINTSKNRSVRRLTAQERADFQVAEDDSLIAVANFFHQNKYWVAVIPRERISDVVTQFIPLFGNYPLFHGQLRFRLASQGRPIRLIEQSKDANSRQAVTLSEDIIFALYAVRGQDHEEAYSIFHGLEGYYAASYVLGSVSQYTSSDSAKEIRQYRLSLTGAQAAAAMEAGIDLGTQFKMTQVYNTLQRSCHTAMFDVLHQALGQPQDGYFARIKENIDPTLQLEWKGFMPMDGSSRIEDFSEPQPEPSASPS